MWRKKAGLYLGFLIIAGFLASLVVQLLLCLWPLVHASSLAAAFLAALAYVSAAVLSGLAATRFFWNPSRDEPFLFLEPVCAHQRSRLDLDTFRRVVVPAGLNRRSSAGGNGGRAHGDWSGKSDAGWRGTLRNSSGWRTEARELFAQSLLTPRREGHAFIIALCIYAGFFALRRHALPAASILRALATFLLAWKLTLEESIYARKQGEPVTCRAATGPRRLTAIMITTAVILLGFQRGIGSSAMDAASAIDRSYLRRTPQEKSRASKFRVCKSQDTRASSYGQFPRRKNCLPPPPSGTSPQVVRMTSRW